MTSLINPSNWIYLMRFHRKLMRFLRILFMRSRQKVMTSATLIYSPHLNEIPPQKRGLTGPSYTTATNAMETNRVKERVFYMSCFDRFTKLKRNDEIEASPLISFAI